METAKSEQPKIQVDDVKEKEEEDEEEEEESPPQREAAKPKRNGGLRRSTTTSKNNCRVALSDSQATRRSIFEITAVDPPATIRLPTLATTAVANLRYLGRTKILVAAGRSMVVLSPTGSLPARGKVWVLTVDVAAAVDVATVEAAGDWAARTVVGFTEFVTAERGSARVGKQRTGTRMKPYDKSAQCYRLDFGPRPLWVACDIVMSQAGQDD